jgi:tetratricopeptide (TPR) repeat protein
MNALRAAAIALTAIAALCGCASHPPVLTDAAAHLPRQVELGQVPFFPQEQYQCGPAALATVLQAAQVPVSAQELTAAVYLPKRKGSLQLELIAATRLHDRMPYELPPQLPALLQQVAAGRPVLVMQNLGWKIAPVWHFAVLVGYDLDARTVLLRSAATERLVMDVDRFERTWSRAQRWALIVLEPGELPPAAQPDRYLNAAASLEAIGRLDAASQAYRSALRAWPQSVWPVLGLANINYRNGEREAAEKGYRAALALDTGNIVALNNLAQILADRGCVAQAQGHIGRAAALAEGTSLAPEVAATASKIAASNVATQSETSCTDP